MTPRFFAATSTAALPPWLPAAAAGVIDAFRLPWGAGEAAVVLDRAGNLHLLHEGLPDALPGPLREEFLHHELVRARPLRPLRVAPFWLFAIEAMRQPRNASGLNDPVALDGRLFGPFGDPAAPVAARGALTVTRGDLLAAFADEAADPFHTESISGAPAACHHALLPAGGDTEGHAVLAFPLPPGELQGDDRSNAELVGDLLFGTLAALAADLKSAGSTSALASRVLPVPDRAAVDQVLREKGWSIQGNRATRRKPAVKANLDDALPKGLGELITSALGVDARENRELPPQGTLGGYLQLAREALAELPGWPTVRYRALRDAQAGARPANAPAQLPANAPRPTSQVGGPGGPPRASSPGGGVGQDSANWRADFQDAPGRTVTIRRHPIAARPPAPSKRKAAGEGRRLPPRPSWLDDFES